MSESRSSINKDGQEVLDDTPVAIPLRFKRVKNLSDQIRETLASEEFRRYLNTQELETPEEADDFEVGDDYDPRSPYEMSLEQELRGPEDDERDAADQRERSRTESATRESATTRDGGSTRVRRERSEPKEDEETPRRNKRSANRRSNLIEDEEDN